MAKRTTIYCSDETEDKLDQLLVLAETQPAYWSSLTGKAAPRNLNQLITALVELGHERLVADEPDDSIGHNTRGVPVIVAKNFKIRQLAADYQTISQDPADIRRHHPHLTLEEVRAGLSYYLAHKAEIDAELEQGRQEAQDMQGRQGESPLRERLRQGRNQP